MQHQPDFYALRLIFEDLPPTPANNTAGDVHISNDMAQSSESPPKNLTDADELQSDTQAPRPAAETDAREDTELARLRRRYTSHSHPSSAAPTEKKPSTLLEHCLYAIRKFWRHQVSITVNHDTCRDHLGMLTYISVSRPISI